jgi:hypothetical protein
MSTTTSAQSCVSCLGCPWQVSTSLFFGSHPGGPCQSYSRDQLDLVIPRRETNNPGWRNLLRGSALGRNTGPMDGPRGGGG